MIKLENWTPGAFGVKRGLMIPVQEKNTTKFQICELAEEQQASREGNKSVLGMYILHMHM